MIDLRPDDVESRLRYAQQLVLLKDTLQSQAAVADANQQYQQALLSFWMALAERSTVYQPKKKQSPQSSQTLFSERVSKAFPLAVLTRQS